MLLKIGFSQKDTEESNSSPVKKSKESASPPTKRKEPTLVVSFVLQQILHSCFFSLTVNFKMNCFNVDLSFFILFR